MTAGLIVTIALILLTGLRYGADSRDGRDWRRWDRSRLRTGYTRRHSPLRDLRRLGRAIRSVHEGHTQAWECYLRAQRPWESRSMRWSRGLGGWRLDGDKLPR